jgi:CheY-like chemotaxis protein
MNPPPAKSPGADQSVLIADGDRENVEHIERLLRAAGVRNPIRAFAEADGLRAFLTAVAQEEAKKPCVLFLDPRMPKANGFDAVRWIRRHEHLADLKIVIFSSTNYPEEIESAGELGVHLFLKKHPDVSSLSTIVQHLCGVEAPERMPWNQGPAKAR